MKGKTDSSHRFECVQPELGEQVWRCGLPDCDPDLQRELDRHLQVCDACRLQQFLHVKLDAWARAGRISIEADREPIGEPREEGIWLRLLWKRPVAALASGGGLALAASLALTVLLSPTAPGRDGATRGGPAAPGFERPVEGEVIREATPTLSWRSISGATAYQVTIDNLDGSFSWSGRTENTSLEIPAAVSLPEKGQYRAILEPVPADLAPLGGISVTFRRADLAGFLAYRVQAAPLPVHLLGLLGIAALLTTWPVRRRIRAAVRQLAETTNDNSCGASPGTGT